MKQLIFIQTIFVATTFAGYFVLVSSATTAEEVCQNCLSYTEAISTYLSQPEVHQEHVQFLQNKCQYEGCRRQLEIYWNPAGYLLADGLLNADGFCTGFLHRCGENVNTDVPPLCTVCMEDINKIGLGNKDKEFQQKIKDFLVAKDFCSSVQDRADCENFITNFSTHWGNSADFFLTFSEKLCKNVFPKDCDTRNQ